jgi:endonuclease-3
VDKGADTLKSPTATRKIMAGLFACYPDATTELLYHNPFELLVATVLSAQSTDARVNKVTPALFGRYPDARSLATADQSALESIIVSTGFFRQKSKALLGLSKAIVSRHDGQVPSTMAELTALPGVGRKTANVLLGHALGVPGFPVDRHVLRVGGRLGICVGSDPVDVESQLCAALPPDTWTRASDTLILHGRRVCRPTPKCEECGVRSQCAYHRAVAHTRPLTRRSSDTRKVRTPRR